MLSDGGPSHSDRIQRRVEGYRKQWDANARLDPLWAVLTVDGGLGDGWEETAFFATGRQEIDEVFRFLEASGLGRKSFARALDFGCGVGRLTEPLSRRTASVVGVDISAEMIRRARLYFPNLEFHLNERQDLSDFEDGHFDLIYTNIVLQHLHPEVQRHYIREFARISKPGALVIFQIPSARPNASRALRALQLLRGLSAAKALSVLRAVALRRAAPWRAGMELNVVEKKEVISTAEGCGLVVKAIGDVDWKTFYATHEFRLTREGEEPSGQSLPESHLYFCEKRSLSDRA